MIREFRCVHTWGKRFNCFCGISIKFSCVIGAFISCLMFCCCYFFLKGVIDCICGAYIIYPKYSEIYLIPYHTFPKRHYLLCLKTTG